MQWEKPEFVEILLACEIGSYANAELKQAQKQEQTDARSASK
jgi:coenzyme PQQ precursor peptide PqqA